MIRQVTPPPARSHHPPHHTTRHITPPQATSRHRHLPHPPPATSHHRHVARPPLHIARPGVITPPPSRTTTATSHHPPRRTTTATSHDHRHITPPATPRRTTTRHATSHHPPRHVAPPPATPRHTTARQVTPRPPSHPPAPPAGPASRSSISPAGDRDEVADAQRRHEASAIRRRRRDPAPRRPGTCRHDPSTSPSVTAGPSCRLARHAEGERRINVSSQYIGNEYVVRDSTKSRHTAVRPAPRGADTRTSSVCSRADCRRRGLPDGRLVMRCRERRRTASRSVGTLFLRSPSPVRSDPANRGPGSGLPVDSGRKSSAGGGPSADAAAVGELSWNIALVRQRSRWAGEPIRRCGFAARSAGCVVRGWVVHQLGPPWLGRPWLDVRGWSSVAGCCPAARLWLSDDSRVDDCIVGRNGCAACRSVARPRLGRLVRHGQASMSKAWPVRRRRKRRSTSIRTLDAIAPTATRRPGRPNDGELASRQSGSDRSRCRVVAIDLIAGR